MACALFGEDLELATEKLNSQFQSVCAAAYSQYDFDENTDRAFREEIEATLWGGIPTAKDRKMDRKIAALVARIEACCLSVLRLKG